MTLLSFLFSHLVRPSSHPLTPVIIAVGAQVNTPGLVEEVCNELQSGEHQLEVGQFVVNVTYHAELRGKLPPSL